MSKHLIVIKIKMNFDFTHFFQYLSFFLKNCNFVKKLIFTKILRFFKLFLGLFISFGALVCKCGNKNVFLMLWHFCGVFSIFQFSAFTENGNFQCFLKSFPQRILVLSHTLSNSFRLCKFKKLGLKLLVKMSLKNMKKSKWCKTSFDEYIYYHKRNERKNWFLITYLHKIKYGAYKGWQYIVMLIIINLFCCLLIQMMPISV